MKFGRTLKKFWQVVNFGSFSFEGFPHDSRSLLQPRLKANNLDLGLKQDTRLWGGTHYLE